MAGKVTLTLCTSKPVLHLREEADQDGVTGLKRLETESVWSKRRINRMGIREGCDGAANPRLSSPPRLAVSPVACTSPCAKDQLQQVTRQASNAAFHCEYSVNQQSHHKPSGERTRTFIKRATILVHRKW